MNYIKKTLAILIILILISCTNKIDKGEYENEKSTFKSSSIIKSDSVLNYNVNKLNTITKKLSKYKFSYEDVNGDDTSVVFKCNYRLVILEEYPQLADNINRLIKDQYQMLLEESINGYNSYPKNWFSEAQIIPSIDRYDSLLVFFSLETEVERYGFRYTEFINENEIYDIQKEKFIYNEEIMNLRSMKASISILSKVLDSYRNLNKDDPSDLYYDLFKDSIDYQKNNDFEYFFNSMIIQPKNISFSIPYSWFENLPEDFHTSDLSISLSHKDLKSYINESFYKKLVIDK